MHALSDTPFNRSQFDAWGGRCQAEGSGKAKGCGAMLVPGEAEDVRVRWVTMLASATAALLVVAIALRVYVFPPPLDHIGFAVAQTRIEDGSGEVALEIRRTEDLQSHVRLRLLFIDGSAKTGEDYLIPGSALVMSPGQAQVRIGIPLLADKTFRKSERNFSVVLENVVGRPQHTVIITLPAGNANAHAQLDQAVLNASRIAADIAGFVVKGEMMEQLLTEFRDRPQEYQEYRQQLKNVSENLVRAREAYLQSVRALQAQPPQQVLPAIDRLMADLRQRNFRQQSAALPVLGRQYQELLSGKSPDMDRWVRELGQTVPRVPAGGISSPKV